MNTWKLASFLVACACVTAYAGGHADWYGYPVKDLVYKFEAYTGEKDRWDSGAHDAPPLAPGKASRAAAEFVAKVPLRDDMKEWNLEKISLLRLSPAPHEEWVYVIHFNAVPKSSVWNGPVPWIDIPSEWTARFPNLWWKGKSPDMLGYS